MSDPKPLMVTIKDIGDHNRVQSYFYYTAIMRWMSTW